MNRIYRVFAACLFVAAFVPAAAEPERISFSANRMSGSAGKKDGLTVLEGDAKVTIGTLSIAGDRIELSGKDFRFVSASGNVSGSDTDKGFSFTAVLLSYDRTLEVASFRGSAKLVDSKNDVESEAGIITYNQKTETAFFQTDVRLKRKDIDCKSAFALYRRALSTLELTGTPSVLRGSDEFKADRILVNLDTEHITLDGTVSGSLKDVKKDPGVSTPSPVPPAATADEAGSSDFPARPETAVDQSGAPASGGEGSPND